MPERCFDCPYFKYAVYGKCELKEIWYGIEDRQLVMEQRPNWCPLEAQEQQPSEST